MSQNDFTLANQSFPAFRADLNSALQALASNNSGTSAPSTTFANMWWYDSTNNIMYIRNEDNDAWIKFAELDQTNDKFVLSGTLQLDDGTVSAPALTFNSDTNMGIYRGGTDILKFVTAGTDAVTINASQDVTLAGSLNFANNEKALFGASNNLEIYSDGTSSIIRESGSGGFLIDGANIQLRDAGGGFANFANFASNGAATIYYDGSPKLATTNTGIDVTGTATMDGLTIDASSADLAILNYTDDGAGQGPNLFLRRTSASPADNDVLGSVIYQGKDSGGNTTSMAEIKAIATDVTDGSEIASLNLRTRNGSAGQLDRLKIDGNGDISFYEDTGSTPKMVWRASDERLGIGSSDVDSKLKVELKPSATVLASLRVGYNDTSTNYLDANTNIFRNGSGTTEAMRISSGNLLVGTTGILSMGSSTTAGFQVGGDFRGVRTDGSPIMYLKHQSNDGTFINFYKDTSSVGSIGTDSGGTYFAGNGSSLLSLGDAVLPRSTTGGSRNGLVDLGNPANVFNNLYINGGAYIGGTGSANQLEDYEEGSYQPTVLGSTSGGYTTGDSATYLMYTKVGRIVHVQGNINVVSGVASGTIRMSLPFSSGDSTDLMERGAGTVTFGVPSGTGVTFPTDTIQCNINVGTSASYMTFRCTIDSANLQDLDNTHIPNNTRFNISLTYQVFV